ncbi:aryl-alcohol oxidase-like protein [Obba rivulosa]|uniref:Aryl-alcohol oxidase-like protein n=1 Tax=Obba rivulosa TaxID=1052685 RepID=A0A8E2DLT6_9APHY|nr:aryl-alcohol oxidase-like protein [Obba rivulosa]
MLLLSLISIFLAFQYVQATLYTDPAQLSQTEYDFIVVGAGTAGNVVAARLSEEASFNVLVVEAGISNEDDVDEDNVEDEVPLLSLSLSPNTSLTWNFTTTPQVGLNGRAIPYPRGRVLGGSSTINFMIWTRASEDDWDRFAEFTGDQGWSWDAMLPYMKKSEQLVPSADRHNTAGEIVPELHGMHGPINISIGGFSFESDAHVINTTKELPDEFPFNQDMNSGFPLGVGWTQSSIDSQGHRSSSVTGYLGPAMNRSNLDVLILTQVTKLISTQTVNGLPHFDTIEVAQSPTSKHYTFSARKEVIVSAGSVSTPQLLLLSGIGNAALLRSVDVEPIVELNDVGRNLTDHPFLGNQWFSTSTDSLESVLRNETLVLEGLEQWETTGTGRDVSQGLNQLIWLRLPPDQTPSPDPAAGPFAPHFEILPADGFGSFDLPIPPTGIFMTLFTAVVSPVSRGSVTLASSNPFDFPIIDPGLLSDQADVDVMVQAIKTAFQFLQAPTWDGFIVAPTTDLAAATTDEELAEYVRNFTSTEFHPVGTARMTPTSSKTGVVNPDLHVKNTSGLRVVDASVFPFILAGHLQAGVYALAERAADLIKAEWL